MSKHTITIYGDIVSGPLMSESDWNSQRFAESIANADAFDELEVRLNSPGGSVSDGLTIANNIRALIKAGKKVTAVVDGLAASMASIIAVSCSEVVVNDGGMIMIHRPWGTTTGTADDMSSAASTLARREEQLVNFYCLRPKVTPEQAKAWMATDGVYFTGPEAVAAGLADRVGEIATQRVDTRAHADALMASASQRMAARNPHPPLQPTTKPTTKMTAEEIKTIVAEAVKAAVTPLHAKLDSLEAAATNRAKAEHEAAAKTATDALADAIAKDAIPVSAKATWEANISKDPVTSYQLILNAVAALNKYKTGKAPLDGQGAAGNRSGEGAGDHKVDAKAIAEEFAKLPDAEKPAFFAKHGDTIRGYVRSL